MCGVDILYDGIFQAHIDSQDNAGVYNDVSNFRDWIDTTMESNGGATFCNKDISPGMDIGFNSLVKLE